MTALLLVIATVDPAALGAPEWADRDQAEFWLRQLGEAARPRVEPYRSSNDPETRERAVRILKPLDGRAGDAKIAATWFAGSNAPGVFERLVVTHDDALRHRLALAAWRTGKLSTWQAVDFADGGADWYVWVWQGDAAARELIARPLEVIRNGYVATEEHP